MIEEGFQDLLNPHLLEYLLDLIFTHKSLMPENFLILCIEEYLGWDEANPVCRGKPGFLVNLNNLYDDTILILL